MRNEYVKGRLFNRRAFILTAGKMGLLGVLASRLCYLQVFKSEEYRTLSEGNRVRLIPILPSRGKILDRFGMPLASDHQHFRLIFDPSEKAMIEEVLARIADIIEMEPGQAEVIIKKVKQSRIGEIVIVQEYLSWNEVSAVEVNRPDLPGLIVEMGEERYYPFKEMAAHVIGYLGPPRSGEMPENPLTKHPDFRIGKNGIERTAEIVLNGKPGVRRMEVNAHGVAVRELSTNKSESGQDITTTLDAELQKFAAERIAGVGGVEKEGATVVVMDIKTGGILALASRPGFDPNEFTKGISSELWRSLITNPDRPLINKAISGEYPPGSTFKTVVALAGLEAGIITPQSSVFCPGHFGFGSHTFHCWKKEGHGTLDLKGAIAQSCNVFFYTMGQRIGVEKIAAMARRFGLGSKLNIELPSERPGIIPDRVWKRRTYQQDWMEGETINTAIGQGYVLATPLQLAVLAARLASGKRVRPKLFEGNITPELEEELGLPALDEELEEIGVDPQYMDIVREGMRMVVNEANGTAYRSRIEEETFQMAGKTGTSQVRGKKGADKNNVERKYNNHALFIGFAPYDQPRFSIAVVIEHGGGGSAAAAPIARDVMMELKRLAAIKSYKL